MQSEINFRLKPVTKKLMFRSLETHFTLMTMNFTLALLILVCSSSRIFLSQDFFYEVDKIDIAMLPINRIFNWTW